VAASARRRCALPRRVDPGITVTLALAITVTITITITVAVAATPGAS
jgi:hypothetical protein